MMKLLRLCALLICMSNAWLLQAQTTDSISKIDSLRIKQIIQSGSTGKEDNNRNVLLNAANNTSPRDVNIGLPSSVGGITILENDLPVVYFFWPELPTTTWRQSVGLERTGLLKMNQVALTMGDLGFAVNSYSQTGTKEFKFKSRFTTSHYGWLQGDVNVSGPMSKNGWTYSVGAFLNYDPSTYTLGFARNAEEAKIFRAGITKYFDDDRGKITLNYKYTDSYNLVNYALFNYQTNGQVRELDNFRIGRDSYILSDGAVRFKDVRSGEYYMANLTGNEVTSSSHTINLFGNYKLENDWNFKFSTQFRSSKAARILLPPLSIFSTNAPAQSGNTYTIASTGERYEGNVGTQLAMNTPPTPLTTVQGRFSLEKKVDNHFLTFGLLEQFYRVNQFVSNRSFFYQTAEAQPRLLIGPNTDEYGFYGYNLGSEYHNGIENKLSIYANDEWKVNDRFNLNYGLIFRNHIVNGDYSQTPRTPDFTLQNATFTDINYSWYHIGGSANATYNLTRQFGLMADFQYTEQNRQLEGYSLPEAARTNKIRSPLGAFGIFYNNDFIQLISQATFLTRNDYLSRFNLVNPVNASEAVATTTYYDIQTIGWTTDFVLNPFKGFNLHYLITLQNPVYKNFNFEAFGVNYNYSDNNVLGVSKVLMEIDPSYEYKKWKVWASFRYFSDQFANLTNVLYFAPRWETFGGVSYKLNKNIDLNGRVINFLNQRGASGTVNGAELVTDASLYENRLLTGSYMMPFTVQFSVGINF